MRMRKKVVSLIGFVFYSFLCLGQTGQSNGFIIKVFLKNAENKYVYLDKVVLRNARRENVDSCLVRQGKFLLTGKVDETDLYQIKVERANGYFDLILENIKYEFRGNADSIWTGSISGGEENARMWRYRKSVLGLVEVMNTSADSAMAASARNDSVLTRTYTQLNGFYSEKMQARAVEFVEEHPGSFYSLLLLSRAQVNAENARILYPSLHSSLKSHSRGRKLYYVLYELDKVVSIGKAAPEIVQRDTSDLIVSLSELRGRYVLIDFWASWCGPCRKEHPHLREIYKRYKNRGFEIMSISLDENRERWKHAIKADNLIWKNTSDLKGWKGEAARTYGVDAVPFNILVDPAGLIAGKNINLESLEKILNETLKTE